MNSRVWYTEKEPLRRMPQKETKSYQDEIIRSTIGPNIHEYTHKKMKWVNITETDEQAIDFLDELGILADDIEDIHPARTRSKILIRNEYIFLVLLFPVVDKRTNTIRPTEVDFFIYKNTLITVHHNKLKPLIRFPDDLMNSHANTHTLNEFTPAYLVNHILTHLYEYCLPISNKLANEIDEIEGKIYEVDLPDQPLVEKIFTLNRKVVDFRKIMRSHQINIKKLIQTLPTLSKASLPHDLLQDLSDLPLSIWTNLEAHVEAIDAMQSSYESLTSYRLNDIIRTLTIISVVLAPMTLITGIFGMNFVAIPYRDNPIGFMLALILMFLLGVLSVLFFKLKKWL